MRSRQLEIEPQSSIFQYQLLPIREGRECPRFLAAFAGKANDG